MPAQEVPRFVDEAPAARQLPGGDLATQERTVVEGAEADADTVSASSHVRKAACLGEGARFRFGDVAHGQQHPLQDVLLQSPEEEGLVLGAVGGRGDEVLAVQLDLARVVSGGNPGDALFIGDLCQQAPLQEVVAQGAGHGGVSGKVLVGEVADDVRGELPAGVMHDVLHAQPPAERAGALQVVRVALFLVEAEGDACHREARVEQPHGSHRAVRSATHSQQYVSV